MPHPYTTTVHGLNTLIHQLRSAFPARLTPETLRTWNIGRSNESSLLATLRFLGVVDEDRNTLPQAKQVFEEEDEEAFAEGLAAMVRQAYAELFAEYGDAAWTLSRDALIAFMRAADRSSARVGDQQAITFQALARQAGKGSVLLRAAGGGRRRTRRSVRAVEAVADRAAGPRSRNGSARASSERGEALPAEAPLVSGNGTGGREVGVRIEIHLPLTDDPAVYDEIFRSIRRHLLDR